MIYCGEIYQIWYLKVGDKEGKHLIDLDLIQVFSRSLMTVFVGRERTAGAVSWTRTDGTTVLCRRDSRLG